MTNPAVPPSSTTHPLETILRQCAAATPQPWYPSDYAKATGTVRDELDPHLNRLRLGGLIRLTDWVKGQGQGYVLTPEGTQVLENPHALSQLAGGQMPESRPVEEEAQASPEITREEWDRAGTILDDLQRPQRAVLTNLILAVTIAWFLAGAMMAETVGLSINQYLSGPPSGNGLLARQYGETIHRLGALTGDDLVRGQWWRLLTCCFVHYGLIHLGANMLSLYFIGPMMERMWGRGRFLAIYLIAGLGGSCIAMILHPVGAQLAGASGALWGAMASQAVWIMVNRRYLPPTAASAGLRQLLSVFLLNAFISMMPGVSAAAHFGGGAVGAAAAFLANYQRYGSPGQRRWALLGLILSPVLCVAALAGDMAADPRWQPVYLAGEQNGFLDDYRDLVTITAEATLEVYAKQAKSLLEKNPARRDPSSVTQTSTALAAKQQELEAIARQLQGTGPYRTPKIEAARELATQYVDSLIEMCRLTEKCLEAGPNHRKDDRALAEHLKTVEKLRDDWDRIVGYRPSFDPFAD